MYRIHNGTFFMQDPDSFDPDAHFGDDVMIPSAFLAFGQGPRNCIGMRFAWTIMKSLLTRVLLDYKVFPGPGMRSVYTNPNIINNIKCFLSLLGNKTKF